MLQAFIDAKYPPSKIFVSEKSPDNINRLKKKYNINFGINPKTDILILAVKPQHI
ncbi:MAG: hypothetical protein WCG98_05405 [bacterium]